MADQIKCVSKPAGLPSIATPPQVFRLDKYKSIPEAVTALLEILAMDPCEV